jgi:hypothetical protein
VKDLDREVLALLAEDLLDLLIQHLARAVVRVDDVVAELELDELGRGTLDVVAVELAVLVQQVLFNRLDFRNGCPPCDGRARNPPRSGLQVAVHEIYLL